MENIVEGDVATIEGMLSVAEQANDTGAFDAVIHNVAVGYSEPRRIKTADGLPHVFAVNVLAPHVLTALMHKPKRLIYVSSGLHKRAKDRLDDLLWVDRRWDGMAAYCESKLYNAMQAFHMARLWPNVLSNALEPGWVPTRMGGPFATGNLSKGGETQAWLATSEEAAVQVSGNYFYHKRRLEPGALARDTVLQERLIAACEQLSGVRLPSV